MKPEGTPTADGAEAFLKRLREERQQRHQKANPPVSECAAHMLAFVSGYDRQVPERNRPPLTAIVIQDEFSRFKTQQVAAQEQSGATATEYTLWDVIIEAEEQINFKRIDLSEDQPTPGLEAKLIADEKALGWLVHAVGTGSVRTTPPSNF